MSQEHRAISDTLSSAGRSVGQEPWEGIVKLTNPSIQPLLPVTYSPLWHHHRRRTCIGQTHSMMPPPATTLYKRHRFPAEIISHCVWLYFRFSLSYRDVQEMMAERGVVVSH